MQRLFIFQLQHSGNRYYNLVTLEMEAPVPNVEDDDEAEDRQPQVANAQDADQQGIAGPLANDDNDDVN